MERRKGKEGGMTMNITEILLGVVSICFWGMAFLYRIVSRKNRILQKRLECEKEQYKNLMLQFYSRAPQMMDDDD